MTLLPLLLIAASTLQVYATPPDSDGKRYRFAGTVTHEVDAANIAAGDVLTELPLPQIYGAIGRVRAVVSDPITTGAKAATLGLEIGEAAVAGGAVALAGAYALGAVVAGSAITAAHTFEPGDTVSIVASAVTAFTEGRVRIEIEIYELIPA